jgi:hypothetical protein
MGGNKNSMQIVACCCYGKKGPRTATPTAIPGEAENALKLRAKRKGLS